ncbi:MAG: BLUF domain-containing protein [Bacteroidota bacterium]
MKYLIYASTRTCTDDELIDIYKVARAFNSEKDITGILLYSADNFVQYLEGEYEPLNSLYHDKILKDNRHKDVRLLVFEDHKKRYFSEWSMGRKEVNNKQIEFFETFDGQIKIKEDFTEIDEGTQKLLDLWEG